MASQAKSAVAVIRQNLTAMEPEFRAALPSHVPVEKFTRVAMTAIQNNPALQNADRRSLFGAIVRLAQDGLLPDGREAAIVMFKNQAQAMPMIAGVLKKIRQSGEVAKVSAHVVHEKDHFVWKLGFDETVEHEPPPLDQPRGKPIGAYATAVLKDGSQLCEVMSLEEIEQVRKVSRAANNGPWVTWWGEMARKTVMRRLSKRLPMSTDLEDQFDRDETLKHANERPDVTVIDGGRSDDEPVSRLDALEHHIEDEAETANEETGEVETVEAEVVEQDGGPEPTEETDPEPEPEPSPNTNDEAPAEPDEASPAEQFLTRIRGQIGAAKNASYLRATEEEWLKNRAAYDDGIAGEIDAALTAKRKALSGGEGE